MKGNRLTKIRKYERVITVKPMPGKNAQLIWDYTNEVLCSISSETARGLAYDLLKYAKETDKKYIRGV